MDLISREAAIDKLNAIPPGNWSKARYTRELWNVPSVPAVPLEPLCEWLADNYEPPAKVSNGKALDDHEFCVRLWRYVLEKMMEEQDATDRR